MKLFISKIITGVTVFMAAISTATAGNPTVEVPEPSMLPLFAVAAIALYISKKRRK